MTCNGASRHSLHSPRIHELANYYAADLTLPSQTGPQDAYSTASAQEHQNQAGATRSSSAKSLKLLPRRLHEASTLAGRSRSRSNTRHDGTDNAGISAARGSNNNQSRFVERLW